MKDFTDIPEASHVQVQIRSDGHVLWVTTAEQMTVLRISGIETIEVLDDRKDGLGYNQWKGTEQVKPFYGS